MEAPTKPSSAFCHPSPFFLLPPSPPRPMQPSSSSSFRQQFIPLLPDQSRARQHSAPSLSSPSIWAPQPRSPGGTWPRAILSFDEAAALHGRFNRMLDGSFPVVDDRPVRKEDVFGPVGGTQLSDKKEVGAIGDGRQKDPAFPEADVRPRFLRRFAYCATR